MKSLREFPCVLLHRDSIDFRKGIFGLSAYIQMCMGESPFQGTLFVFINRSRTAIKLLYWDKTGFALWMKVLEKEKFLWPKKARLEKIVINSEQMEWLLQGFDILSMKPHEELEFSVLI